MFNIVFLAPDTSVARSYLGASRSYSWASFGSISWAGPRTESKIMALAWSKTRSISWPWSGAWANSWTRHREGLK